MQRTRRAFSQAERKAHAESGTRLQAPGHVPMFAHTRSHTSALTHTCTGLCIGMKKVGGLKIEARKG